MFLKTNEIPHQCFFKADDAGINKKQEYSNFLHTYCDEDHARYLSDRLSVTSTAHLFNGTSIEWCVNKNMRYLKAVPIQKQQKLTQKY